ncbi:PREDICTED: pyroglutamylated RFamide peptide receptor-like [Acropora digitifera]|uniref:pyroglutamylated RFamide peptide receptor-like n=1 Tax=Acropora digitifera TaxID=70779 RepID=UPI00077A9798|nr:PREDICTED: pyroglutamylated RFamide peptide receptor-like [Acropora digitifera]
MVQDLEQAEVEILKIVQRDAFDKEVKTLKESQAQTEGVCKDHQCAKERKALLKKTSSLNTLDPYLDVTGVLRVGGWIMKANPTDSLKNPVILPKTGHISELIIRHIHKKTHHSGRGVTLNELRSNGYWIINSNAAVRRFISRNRFSEGLKSEHKNITAAALISCDSVELDIKDGSWVSAVSSVCTLLAIAIERFYTVMYPHGDRWKLTKRKVKIIITASWLFSLVFISPMFLGMKVTNGICVDTWTGLEWFPKVMTSAVNVVVFGPLLVMVALYSRVVYTLWFKSNDGNQISNQQKGVIRVRKRVTLMLAVVSGIFAICWGTIQVLYSLLHYTSYEISPVVVAISNTMVLFNSAVNPFVYALSSQNFREKVKGMICTCKTVVHPTGRVKTSIPKQPHSRCSVPSMSIPSCKSVIISSSQAEV